jgi:hypothetical protein
MEAFMEAFSKEGGTFADLVKLRDLQHRYETLTDDTVLPDLLILYHGLKVYPPFGVLAHLARGFQEFSESKGKKRLEKCLGIEGKPGSRSRFTQQALVERDRLYVETIKSLQDGFGLGLTDACKIAADTYQGPALSLKPEVIERTWKSSAWKAYKSIPDTASDLRPDGVGHDIPLEWSHLQDTADSTNAEKGIKKKKKNNRRKGRPITPANLLVPIALNTALAKKIPSEISRCLNTIEKIMKSADWVDDPLGYLPKIQKFLEDKKVNLSPSKRISALAAILREARDDPKNPLEFPKSNLPAKAKGDPLLRYL